MLYNHIEKDILQETFQKLTFDYCISLSELCGYSYTIDKPYIVTSSEDTEVAEYTMSVRKYGRILQRLCKENHTEKTAGKLIDKPKIYDDYLFESQTELYNIVAEAANYTPIDKILPNHLIKEAAFLDGALPDYETIAKYYPYYLREKRNGFNFIEFVLLVNIYLTCRSRGLNTLNKPISSTRDKKRVKNMVNAILKNMNSEEIFQFYVHAFFDVFESVACKYHNDKAGEYIRIAWLPERLKNRKDAFRAFETHKKDKIKITTKKYEESQFENITKKGSWYEQVKMNQSMLDYNAAEFISQNILPITFNILLNNTISDEFIKSYILEYTIAKNYADIIKYYINKALQEVTKILNTIYN